MDTQDQDQTSNCTMKQCDELNKLYDLKFKVDSLFNACVKQKNVSQENAQRTRIEIFKEALSSLTESERFTVSTIGRISKKTAKECCDKMLTQISQTVKMHAKMSTEKIFNMQMQKLLQRQTIQDFMQSVQDKLPQSLHRDVLMVNQQAEIDKIEDELILLKKELNQEESRIQRAKLLMIANIPPLEPLLSNLVPTVEDGNEEYYTQSTFDDGSFTSILYMNFDRDMLFLKQFNWYVTDCPMHMDEIQDTHNATHLLADAYSRHFKYLKDLQHTDEIMIEFYDSIFDRLQLTMESNFVTLLDAPPQAFVPMIALISYQVSTSLAKNLVSKRIFDQPSKVIEHSLQKSLEILLKAIDLPDWQPLETCRLVCKGFYQAHFFKELDDATRALQEATKLKTELEKEIAQELLRNGSPSRLIQDAQNYLLSIKADIETYKEALVDKPTVTP